MTKAEQREHTRRALIDATMRVIRERGIAGVSTRTIANAAGVAQGLVAYHFGGVSQLVGEACRVSTQERVDAFADRFDAVQSFGDLVTLAEDIHTTERATGNVAVLAQVLAGAQSSPELEEVAAQALALWTDKVEDVLGRLLIDSPFDGIIDPASMSQWVAAEFVGLELMPGGEDRIGPGLARLAATANALDGMGSVARRAVRAALGKR